MKTILNQIYDNLQKGLYYYEHKHYFYPQELEFDNIVLWQTQYNNIGWEHYGRSACKNTKKELKWLLKNIFELTPLEFINTYKLSEEIL